VLLGVLSLAIVMGVPRRISMVIPSPLIAIVVGTAVAVFWLNDAPVVGTIPSGLPQLILPRIDIESVALVIRYALVLAFLGSVDSLLTSLVADSVTRTNHDSDRELIGQGVGNLVAGMIGAIPGAGATMRTLVNIRAGAKTRLSGMIHALVLLAIVLLFADVAAHVPLAVLAGILIKVGFDIIDWRSLRRLPRAQPATIVILLSTLGITVFVDLITAVAVGVVMASVLFVARMADAQVESAKMAYASGQGIDLSDEEAEILDAEAGRILLFHIEGPLSFGSARDISRMMQQRMEKDALVVDLSSVPFMDSSAAAALEEVIERLHECNDAVFLFGVRPGVMNLLVLAGIPEMLGPGEITQTRIEALRAASRYVRHEAEAES
jgi:SulP family sulfate permease